MSIDINRLPEYLPVPTFRDFIIAEDNNETLNKHLNHAKVKRYNNNTLLRNGMSVWASALVTLWLIFVALVLIINDRFLCLSDNVLITLITTTTINVIGIILICFRDLFNGKSEDSIK